MNRSFIVPTLMTAALIAGCGPAVNPHPVVVMETTRGTIELTLDAEKAPVSVKNFLAYAEVGFYDSLIFHRVIPRFIIQGGGFDVRRKERLTREPIKNESGNGLTSTRGSIAMARTNELNSATSQFYINLRDNFRLDEMKYAVFGEVTAGMDVVDAISTMETVNLGGAFANIPKETVMIRSVTVKR